VRRPLLALLIAASLGIASAQGAANTLTCSLTPRLAGCYVERPAFGLGNFAVSFGVDGQVGWGEGRSSYLAPYALVTYDADRWGAWLEVSIPESRVPVLGRPDPWRLGVRWRF
jgi:hypothetical protein